MASVKCLILLIIMFPMLMLSFAIEDDTYSEYSLGTCEPSTDDKSNDTYEANMKALLSYLSSNATQDNGFYSTVVGWGTANPIRGQILCRGDVTPTTCQRCVTVAGRRTLRHCPNGTESVTHLDLCMLHYTRKSYQFDTLLYSGSTTSLNRTETSEKSRFNQTVWVLLRNVTAKAANSNLPDKKFATHEVPVTATQKLYGLAQCTPDLTVSQCSQCFQTAFQHLEDCCTGSPGATIYLAGCDVRYDTRRFYNVSKLSNVPDVHPTPPLVHLPPSGKRHPGSTIIVVIVAAIIISAMLFCLSCYLLRRKLRKREQAILTENCNHYHEKRF